jgi:two-component system response regulator
MNAGPGLLLVDDDENDLRMIAAVLGGTNAIAAVNFVHDGAEALDYLHGRGAFAAEPPPLPGLILLDLHMPRVNGWEVLRQVKGDERLRSIPIVIFSSSARDSDVAQSYALGANAYVVKPIDFTEFGRVVRAIQGFWLQCNQFPLLPAPATPPRPAPSVRFPRRRPAGLARSKSP